MTPRLVSAKTTSCPGARILAPTAQVTRENRWRHIEHLASEFPGVSDLGSSMALTLLWDDIFRVCSGSDHAEAVLLAAFLCEHVPTVAASACLVPFNFMHQGG